MAHRPTPRCQSIVAALTMGVLLAGCATTDLEQKVRRDAESLRTGPRAVPQQNITSFSPALRCMDSLFASYGVRDVGVLVEDLTDHTKKVNAGAKDMLISAISQMTIRSKAVKLVVYGQDSGNLIGLLRESQRKHAYASLPDFDIKGSISQLDENVVRRQGDLGLNISDKFSIGASRSGSGNVLAIDLSVLSTSDLSLVPGVTSRNSVVIFKSGTGVDGEAQIRKFGINFNLSLAQSEGQTQALRTLLELAAIELLGKLTKVPFWTCLGSNANEAQVRTETADWFAGMLADRADLVRWFQNQMRVRGLYRGAVDGEANAELAEAVAAYRERLGLARNFKIDLEFFRAYLNAKHAAPVAFIVAPAHAAAAATPQPATAAATTSVTPSPTAAAAAAKDAPLKLSVSSSGGDNGFRRGEAIDLIVAASRDAYVYCYLQDENHRVVRFFPNRFERSALVKTGTALALPGKMRFQLVANQKGVDELVACFAAERDLSPELSKSLVAADFEPMTGKSLDSIKRVFRQLAGGAFVESLLPVRVR